MANYILLNSFIPIRILNEQPPLETLPELQVGEVLLNNANVSGLVAGDKVYFERTFRQTANSTWYNAGQIVLIDAKHIVAKEKN